MIDEPHSALYRGTLLHARRDELAKRTFDYPVYMASLDLDELAELSRRSRLFSFARPNLFSIYPRDYPVVQCAVFVSALVFIVVNFCVDVAYGLLDPRVRLR